MQFWLFHGVRCNKRQQANDSTGFAPSIRHTLIVHEAVLLQRGRCDFKYRMHSHSFGNQHLFTFVRSVAFDDRSNPRNSMTSDIGSRHAPDCYLKTTEAVDAPQLASSIAPPSAESLSEMIWLCSMLGCALPPAFAALVPPSSAAPSSVPIPLPSHLRVHLTDGRSYSGRLHCVDANANIILSHTSQIPGEIDGIPVGGFTLGQILIAWKLIKKIEKLVEKPATK